MPGGTCHFQDKWLHEETFKQWVRRTATTTSARCQVCQREIDISTMGHQALMSHSKGKKHKLVLILY